MLGDKDVCATIAVKDLAAARQFYEQTLGLKVEKETPAGIFYKSGSSGVFVYPSQFAGTNQATSASWVAEDLEPVVSDLKGKGVTFEHYDNMPETKLEGDMHVMGELKAVWFKDPDGNILNVTNGKM